MRKFRKLSKLLGNVNCVRLKVRPHLQQEAKHCIKKSRLELASTVDVLREISRAKCAARISANEVSVEEFRRCFEKPRIPVVISEPYWGKGYSRTQSYPARLRLANFLKLFKHEYLECGEDCNGYSIEIKLNDFLIYTRRFEDKFPLYIFDSSVPHWKGAWRKQIIIRNFFAPPKFFKQDFMAWLGKVHRPPWKWLLIGPKNSGTSIHIDPLGTSAWNRLLYGEKLWLLFPPVTSADLLKLNAKDCLYSEEASDWITTMYPRTQCNSWPQDCQPLIVFQHPGEVVFVPSGWWHVVLNLKTSIAVTQNFVSRENFPLAWGKTLEERPDMAKLWSKALSKCHDGYITPLVS